MKRSLRAAVVSPPLNVLGGAEKVTLEIIAVLRDLGYSIDVITVQRTNRQALRRLRGFNMDAYVDKEIVILPFRTLPTIYATYILWLLRDIIAVPLLRKRYDLTITTCEYLPLVFTDLLYLHSVDGFVAHPHNIFLQKYRASSFWIAYSRPYWSLAKRIANFFKLLGRKPIVLTNSRFSQSMIRKHLNVNALLIYPPAGVEQYLLLSGANAGRTDTVATVSRLVKGKRLEDVVRIAQIVKCEARFIIIGSVHLEGERRYAEDLQEMVTRAGLNNRIDIVINASDDEKKRLLSQAKILVHPTHGEHFGISIVEGMAAGLIPLVHRSGGAWEEIVGYGKYGFGFSSVQEAASVIDDILTYSELYEKFKIIATERSLFFSDHNFRRRFADLISVVQSALSRTRFRAT